MPKEKIIWEADVECTSCGGTGLYQGFAEKGKAAVICYTCKGTGKEHIKHTYTKFIERKNKKGVKRVYKTSAGMCITDEDVTTEADEENPSREIKFSQGGVSYSEWKKGKSPLPIYDLHCPLQHFEQGSKIGEWLKDHGPCKDFLNLGGSLSECAKKNRDDCWGWYNCHKGKVK
jgi:hypothetical protein